MEIKIEECVRHSYASSFLIQRQGHAGLIEALRARSQASFNYFYNIGRRCDVFRDALENTQFSDDEKLHIASDQIQLSTGIMDTARTDIIAYSREHLKYVLFYEHSAHPKSLESTQSKSD